jgi:hypothetical protein
MNSLMAGVLRVIGTGGYRYPCLPTGEGHLGFFITTLAVYLA